MSNQIIGQVFWKRRDLDFTFIQAPPNTELPDQEVIHRREYDNPAISRRWQLRRDYSGWQFIPVGADFVEANQETIERSVLDVPERGKTKWRKHSFDGWTQMPLPADNYEAFSRYVYENPPVSKRWLLRRDYSGWQAAPLAADNDISVTHVEYEVPRRKNPRREPWYGTQDLEAINNDNQDVSGLTTFDVPYRRNPRRNPYDGVQFAGVGPDAVVGVPLPMPVYPDVMPRQRFTRRHYFIFDGFIVEPTPADNPFVPSPNVYIPNIRPRRR